MPLTKITRGALTADIIDSTKLADNAVDTEHLATDAITGAKIEDNAVDTEHIAASAVETAKINNDAVSLDKMASGTDGAFLTYDGSGNPVEITGTDGQVATSAGANTVSAMEDAPTTDISGKANIASPTFTGTPVTPVLKVTPTATASAPTGAAGMIYYDSDKNAMMTYDTSWRKMAMSIADGGDESTYGSYTIHTFNASGTFTVHSPTTCDILMVAGGAGGGGSISSHGGGGGGGAGGTVFYPAKSLSAGDYTIVIGGGGSGGTQARGATGSNSTFTGLTNASGGGGGGCGNKSSGAMTGLNGGCGGGAGWHDQNGARGRGENNASNQGNHGGNVSQDGTGCNITSSGGAGGAGGGGAGGLGRCNGTIGGINSGGTAGAAATEGTTAWHDFTDGSGTETVDMDGTSFTWGEGGDGGAGRTAHREANKGDGGHAIYGGNQQAYHGGSGFVMVRYLG